MQHQSLIVICGILRARSVNFGTLCGAAPPPPGNVMYKKMLYFCYVRNKDI